MDPQLGGGKDVQKGLHWLGSFSIYLPITYLRLQKSKFKTAATFWDQKDTQNKVKKKKKRKNSQMDIISQQKICKELPNLTISSKTPTQT